MANAPNMSLAEIEAMLNHQKQRLNDLKTKQTSLQNELESVTQEIAVLEGKGKGKGSGRRGRPAGSKNQKKKSVKVRRAKNAQPLRVHVTDILSKNKQGLTLDELTKAVEATGYKSKSKNFNNVVYQCLYNNTDEFAHDSKSGKYTVKK